MACERDERWFILVLPTLRALQQRSSVVRAWRGGGGGGGGVESETEAAAERAAAR